MKKILLVCMLFPVVAFCQKTEDSKVIIRLSDTTDIYNNIKYALGKNDFAIREDGNRSIITTFPAELRSIPGYSAVRAEIKGNDVILTGVYGLIKVDDWGYTRTPKDYHRIIYFKGSKAWKRLLAVADKIQNKKEVSYSK